MHFHKTEWVWGSLIFLLCATLVFDQAAKAQKVAPSVSAGLSPRALIVCPTCTAMVLDEVRERILDRGGSVPILLPPQAALVRLDADAVAYLEQARPELTIYQGAVELGSLPETLDTEVLELVLYWNDSLAPSEVDARSSSGTPAPLSETEGATGDELEVRIGEEVRSTHEAIRSRAPTVVAAATRTVEGLFRALDRGDFASAESFIAPGDEGRKAREILVDLAEEMTSDRYRDGSFALRAGALDRSEVELRVVDSEDQPTATVTLKRYGLGWKVVEVEP